jgi:5-methylcytosine-specific restriction endonuclease McrA
MDIKDVIAGLEKTIDDPTACQAFVSSVVSGLKTQSLPIEDDEVAALRAIVKEENIFDEATRKRVLKRDRYHCIACGTGDNLDIHHIFPRRLGGTLDDINLITLCRRCHIDWEVNFRSHWKRCGFEVVLRHVL